MHPRTRTSFRVRQVQIALATLLGTGLLPGAWAQAVVGDEANTLRSLFEAAWERQPEARALQAHREAVQARRHAAAAWTPEPPALEVGHKTDRLSRNDGAREWELGVSVPLWLPGERGRAGALVEAEAVAVENRAAAARWRLAATVREAWWHWQRTRADAEIARVQLENARRIAQDVARRVTAGDLPRADQHQAESAVAVAEVSVAQAEAAAAVARQQVKSLRGGPVAVAPIDTAEPAPPADGVAPHPALAELESRAAVAAGSAALAATQSRANPELTLAGTRDRGAVGERYGQTVTLAVRIPFGGGARHDAKVAQARAEAAEAEAQLALERTRVRTAVEAAVAQVESARLQRSAAERRATLAQETRSFFQKSFQLGETDLPTRLRIEAEAADAERQSARSHIDLAAAISAWRQALGLLPQ